MNSWVNGLLAATLLCAPAAGIATASEALPNLDGASVVILGEVHDNPLHHENQARALRQLQPAAVVFEMLDPAQAETVNETAERGAALAEAIAWAESGWPEWALYAPVFAALGTARIYGMALPRETVRRAVSEGAADAFPGDAARFGLDIPLSGEEQQAREAAQRAAHCDALPEALLPGMVEAQRLRDAHFADVILQALAETGGPVAVITGTGHARRDWGIPAALGRADPGMPVLSLGQTERGDDLPDAFDASLVTDPAERPDPCAAFDKGKAGTDG